MGVIFVRMATARRAAASELHALCTALALAFADELITNWMMPQRTRRRSRRELMFMMELTTYVLPNGGLTVTLDDDDDDGGGLAGGCMSLPPDKWRTPDAVDGRTALRWTSALGVRLPRAIRLQKALQQDHPVEPHYYVRWVGVKPALQGQGLGSALMQPTLDRCDAENMPAFLEASSERSAALYERLGFIHLGVRQLPDGGPLYWPMRRPPGA